MKALKCLTVIFLSVLAVLSACFTCYASVEPDMPYDTYVYIETADGKKAVESKALYGVESITDGKTLGFEGFEGIQDIYVTKENEVYILDSIAGKVIVLNSDLSLKKIIVEFQSGGKETTLNAPQGIFIDKNKTIWIADTENQRIINIDESGKVLNEWLAPEGDLIPEDLKFFPMKITMDNKGYVYVLCRGSYYGAMVYNSKGDFLSFYGANKVKTGLLGGLQRIFQRMFASNEKLAVSAKKLPYQFLDFEIDSEDFVYTVSSSAAGQVRKLGPNGENSLFNGKENSDSFNFGDNEFYVNDFGLETKQNFTSLTVDKNGNIFILDSSYGKIYAYDSKCRNIGVFGGGLGKGTQQGTFILPCSISVFGDGLLVADSLGGNITYFTPTDYGKKILNAEDASAKGEYDEAISLWNEVLNESTSYQLAYRNIAKAYYAKDEYDLCMENAKRGMDQDMYAKAYKEINEEFISDNFWWLFILVVAVVISLVILMYISVKKRIVFIKNEKWSTATRVLCHPFEVFNDIKYKQKGSFGIATIFILLFYVLSIFGKEYGGFMHSLPGKSGIAAFYTFLGTAGITVLFAVVNWAMSTLFEGKGRFSEIYIATAYSLIPLIIYKLIYIVGTHFIAPGEVSLLTYIAIFCYIATAWLLIIGQIIVNDYTLWKTLTVGILTLLGMIIIGILVFAMVILIQNIVGFAASVFNEAFLR